MCHCVRARTGDPTHALLGVVNLSLSPLLFPSPPASILVFSPKTDDLSEVHHEQAPVVFGEWEASWGAAPNVCPLLPRFLCLLCTVAFDVCVCS